MKLVKSVEKNGVVCKLLPWPIYRFSWMLQSWMTKKKRQSKKSFASLTPLLKNWSLQIGTVPLWKSVWLEHSIRFFPYRSLTVTDGSQLQKIKDEIKKSVVTPYIDMIDKYGGRDFAKGNTSKYVKYSTEAITAEIEKIFDLSAWYSILWNQPVAVSLDHKWSEISSNYSFLHSYKNAILPIN